MGGQGRTPDGAAPRTGPRFQEGRLSREDPRIRAGPCARPGSHPGTFPGTGRSDAVEGGVAGGSVSRSRRLASAVRGGIGGCALICGTV
nr:hypothetical protein GCM10020093_074470 [Planobispora longispora]